MSNHHSDEQLVESIKENDADSFKQLYYRYYEMLYRFAFYRVYSSDSACEVVQELFYRIWLKRQLLDPHKSIKAYLYKTLNNIIINRSKLSSVKNISTNQLAIKDNSEFGNNIELKIDLQEAIDCLPYKIRSVYLLSRIEGFKYSEIAELCGVSVKAVEKRMSKAICLLRKNFSEKYFE